MRRRFLFAAIRKAYPPASGIDPTLKFEKLGTYSAVTIVSPNLQMQISGSRSRLVVSMGAECRGTPPRVVPGFYALLGRVDRRVREAADRQDRDQDPVAGCRPAARRVRLEPIFEILLVASKPRRHRQVPTPSLYAIILDIETASEVWRDGRYFGQGWRSSSERPSGSFSDQRSSSIPWPHQPNRLQR